MCACVCACIFMCVLVSYACVYVKQKEEARMTACALKQDPNTLKKKKKIWKFSVICPLSSYKTTLKQQQFNGELDH